MSPSNPSIVACPSEGVSERSLTEPGIGSLLEEYRQYLLLIADQELGQELQAKGDASDLVQETFLEAYAGFSQYHGEGDGQLRAWLREILVNNIANFRRFFCTAKRDASREIYPQTSRQSPRLEELIVADTTSPSGKVMKTEALALLQQVVDGLPDDYRAVFLLRHKQHLGFQEIGRRMKRSTDAARMLWWRAFERVAEQLERTYGGPCNEND